MGDDPTDSVVNSYAQSHEAPNLFVIGGGIFPTLSAYNPTATIQALAYRTADYIKREAHGGRCAGGDDHPRDSDGLGRGVNSESGRCQRRQATEGEGRAYERTDLALVIWAGCRDERKE